MTLRGSGQWHELGAFVEEKEMKAVPDPGGIGSIVQGLVE